MGLERFWRCDYCETDHRNPQPIGWRLTGERVAHGATPREHDIYLCSDTCASRWFTSWLNSSNPIIHPTLKEN